MQSILARIIAAGALIPLASVLWNFVVTARQQYEWEGVAVSREAFSVLGEGLLGPLFLFALASVVDMLFRISKSAPVNLTPTAVAPLAPWRWRSTIAKALLIAAPVMFLTGVWSAVAMTNFASAQTGYALGAPGFPLAASMHAMVSAITEPLWLVGLAAIVEYLARMAPGRRTEA